MIEFKLPELGEGVEKGTVIKVLVSVGDTIAAEQSVLEVEIDKATVELPSPYAGKVLSLAVGEGDEVPVGALVMTLDGDAAPAAEAAPAATAPAPSAPAPAAPAPAKAAKSPAPARPAGAPLPAGPAVRRLARLLGVKLEGLSGSGQRGRITSDDVHAAWKRLGQGGGARAALPPLPDFSAWGEVEVERISTFRKRTAEAMTRSWDTIPHVTNHDLVDVTDLEAARKASRKRDPKGPRVTMTVLVAKACATALQSFPTLNSSLDLAAGELHLKHHYHFGIAVDTAYGLLVPVLRDVERKSILTLAGELTDLAERTREKKVKPKELKGATFTISNLGGIGGWGFTPIVNWPQVAILGVSRGRWQYQPSGGPESAPVARLIMPLSLSYDHRVVDGATAARFMAKLNYLLSNPAHLLFEA